MARIVLLLRGVNVGGVTVRSADLRALLGDAGLGEVRTVLASGNAIVDARSVAAGVRTAEAALEERYGRRIRVHGLTLAALRTIVDAYPFAEDDAHTPYVVFPLEDGVLERIAETETDEDVAVAGGVLHWSNPKGHTIDSPIGVALARVGKDATTTRNLRTLRRIVDAG
ncbi:DUF1697 domain-containing protein [Agrococcus sp. SGAir0287]|uniref:DUF1697 domain-containing protein n=1 Tax=Agrococcus sp. SGAir0287 TaxID=2070347 RepID=UPI0010CCD44E|nr:DUF1697 domain-containing protein [Agrococcus sp. SGAir0287]QCR19387.1 pyridoxamine 5-phosphate oxidase [Agrococcus sp. SGAir0287]